MNTLDAAIDRGAQGLAGVIAQELFLNPGLKDSELYERTIKHPSLSESDRQHFGPLTAEQKQAAFAESAKIVRRILPRLSQLVGVVFDQFKAQLVAGTTSAGFRYSWQGQQLALKVVPVKKELFEPDRESE